MSNQPKRLTKARRRALERTLAQVEQELADADRVEQLKRLRPLVGRCFVYQNSLGGDEKWPLYARVIGLDEEDAILQIITFEHTAIGQISIGLDEHHCSVDSWEEISENDFCVAWQKLLREINALNVLR
jgi:hypothetical protein